MNWIIDTTSKRRPLAKMSAKLAAGIAISAMLAFGTFAAPANADDDGYYRRHRHYYNGGYYRSPPVVYGSPYGSSYYYGSPYYNGSPYHYPPPVVYGPGIGLSLPGVGINIR